MNESKSLVAQVSREVTNELKDEGAVRALLATTFKGLNQNTLKQAIVEGMLRGFEFKDFLEKNVYAIPYGQGYSLVTSIDHSRKIAMRSGLAGKSEPKYEVDKNGDIISCSITVKRSAYGTVGDYTAKVYFKEYSTNKNLWNSKPRTMIAKVAEMHALRSAFPEEMAQHYAEEEMIKEVEVLAPKTNESLETLRRTRSLAGLQKAWTAFTADERADPEALALKNELKQKYESTSSGTKDTGVASPKKRKDNGDGPKESSGK